jgi:plasmid stabilization system protein ParE
MICRVEMSARAERDRDQAYQWYAENNSLDFAARWYGGLTDSIRSLRENPLRCAKAHESDRFPFELSELLFGKGRYKHRILFTLRDERVFILHIRHSAQRDLNKDDLR